MKQSLLARLAAHCYRHRRWVLAGWLLLLITLTLGSKAFGGHWMTSMTLPNTDSSHAAQALERGFPARAGDTATAVMANPTPPQVTSFVAALRHTNGVAGVDTPLVDRSGRVEAIPFTFSTVGSSTHAAAAEVKALASAERQHGLDVELSGPMFDHFKLGNEEVVGILVAVIVLLVAFGSVVAMGLPIITALFGIGIAIAAV
jgi:RND superfamily putative drug exporter